MKKTLNNAARAADCSQNDLLCFCHLRWNFVYQRPQHLMSRFARHRRVFYIEDAVFGMVSSPRMHVSEPSPGLWVATPHLPNGLSPGLALKIQRRLLDDLISEHHITLYTLWYYTPLALAFSDHLTPENIIYDCMDELSHFKFAPPELISYEKQLLKTSDLMFTGGYSLYEVKKDLHANVHPFPSSIDADHFRQARTLKADPLDQKAIPRPRLGFAGVIDERMDIDLIRQIAEARPDWHIIMVGPVVKIDPATLPQHPNIHYLGMKDYQDLPHYFAGWDVAILPFAHNLSTRFISPTKTPEYLSAGRRVISTSIKDVVRPYGDKGLVSITDTAEGFIAAAEELMLEGTPNEWREQVDDFLALNSWDLTWSRMAHLELKLCQVKGMKPAVLPSAIEAQTSL